MNLIYLIGAGRSGTTILSLLLGNSESVTSLGELHQLPEYMGLEGKCSCGQLLSSCPYWNSVYSSLHNQFCSNSYKEQARELESHRYVYKYFFEKNRALTNSEYCSANKALLSHLSNNNQFTIDSAKYIGRGLALNSMEIFAKEKIDLNTNNNSIIVNNELPSNNTPIGESAIDENPNSEENINQWAVFLQNHSNYYFGDSGNGMGGGEFTAFNNSYQNTEEPVLL